MTTLTQKRKNARGQFKPSENGPTVTQKMLLQYQAQISSQSVKATAHIQQTLDCRPRDGVALAVLYTDIFGNDVTEVVLFENYCQWVRSTLRPKSWYADWVTLADLNAEPQPAPLENISDMSYEIDCMFTEWEMQGQENGYVGEWS